MMERHELVITVFGELPKSCEECIFSSYGQRFCRISNRESPNFRFRDDRCVYCRELPKGHGRLIDADKLLNDFSECEMKSYGYNGSCDDCEDRNICRVRVLRKDIEDAPTVLEVSGGISGKQGKTSPDSEASE